jgi:tRNA dimethylallyltransferase
MASNQDYPVVVVAGPTCSGKSALALDVAERFDGTVINADSMQVYRELRILTARPDASAEARAPHRLYGVLSAGERCSAGRWREMAIAEISAASSAGRLPVVCGGTGFYLMALLEGLSPIPDVDDQIRCRIHRDYADVEPEPLHRALAAVDPDAAARFPAGDRQRILRALEVYAATGRSLSFWQRQPKIAPPAGYRFHVITLLPTRPALYAACDRRFEAMMEAGALDEVRRLGEMNFDPALPAMRAVGVPELLRYHAGLCDRETAVSAAQQATRNYAKRQLTWLRHQIVSNLTLDAQYSERFKEKIFSFICEFVLTGGR